MIQRAVAENRTAGRPATFRPYLRYLAAAALVLAAAALRALFLPAPGIFVSVMMFYPAVIIAALYGGLPAGLLAVFLSVFPAFFLPIGPIGHLMVAPPLDWPGMAVFLMVGAVLSGITEGLYHRRLSAETAAGCAAQEENEHLASFPRLNPNPVIELDSRGEVRFYNEATMQTLRELGAPEDIGLFYPADLQEIMTILREGKENANILYREVRIKDRTFGENIYPLKTLGVLRMYVTDMTKQKRAEEELKNSHDELESRIQERTAQVREQTGQLESFFRHTQTCMAFLDRDFNFIRVNDAYARACARDASDFAGHNHFTDYPSEELPGKFQQVIETKQPYCVLGRHFTFPGHLERGVTYWDLYVAPILDESREVAFLAFSLLDVTDREQAERARRESETRYKSLYENSIDGILLTAPDGSILGANPEACRIFGRTEEEIIRAGRNGILDMADPKLSAFIEERTRTGKARGEVTGIRKDGTKFPCEQSSVLFQDKDGNIRTVIIARDITERKQAEERIARLNHLYSLRSSVNEAILRSSDTETLYWEICRIAVEDGSFKMAWVGLLDPETRRITPFISYGDTGGYLQEDLAIYAADIPEGRGPTGTAIFEKTYCVCGDIAHDKRMAPWRDRALTHGFRSSAAFPLFAGSTVIGAFTLYSDKPQVFTDEETGLLDALVEDISFAVDALANEKERRKAEEALHRANAYNRSLIEASLDPLVTIDAGGKITDLNAATEKMTGLSRTVLVGTDFSDYFTRPEDARTGYRQVFRDGSVRDYALEILHTDGHATPVLYNASLYRNEAGEVIGVFAAARDVTERRQAEEIARQDERRNERILRISQHPAASLQELFDLTLTEALAFVESPLGYLYHYNEDTREFTLHAWSKNVMEECTVINPRTVYRLEKTGIWGEVVRQRKPITVNDFTAPHPLKKGYPEGHVALSRFTGIPIFSSGRIVAVVGVANKPADYTDEDVRQLVLLMDSLWKIIERRKAEEEVHKLNEELEQRVAERTRQLEVSNREMESFSYSVSHDLRAPLRAIDGFSRRVLKDYEDKLDAEGKRLLGVIRRNTQNMGQLIDELLAFSRLGKQQIRSSEIDMAGLAEKVYHEISGAASGRSLTVALNAPPRAYADPILIRQVLMNLLSNAVKFTRRTRDAVIEFGGGVEENECVYYVRDNGVGFDMRYADKLFGVFQRLHSEAEFEGTGVGLAIVQRIIARHGGRVWAEGKVNGGAVFYFTLPK